MAKGCFTQGATLLTNARITLDAVGDALRQQGFDTLKEEFPAPEEWAFRGPTVTIPFLPQVNGYATVDLVDRPWPDAMGDPKSDPSIFGAWSMGFFGPFAFPGGLTRARQHAWSWPAGRDIAESHSGFLRIRLSYALGAKEDEPILPADYHPVAEMMFLSRAVLALFKVPGVLCYFNPNGEVLCDEQSFRKVWEPCAERRQLPLSLWTNVRFSKFSESLGFMETVGNAQLDIRDIEAVFPMNRYVPADVDYYLRNVTHYLLELDREMQTGEDIDGPGETNLSWTMEVLDEGVIAPPRRVLRLYPKASLDTVRAAVSAVRRPSK
jgi:hypothetical protein